MERPSFEIELLPDVIDFLDALDEKARRKIYYNMKKSQFIYKPPLFLTQTKQNHILPDRLRPAFVNYL
jgi:hypothetical protein